MNYIEQKVETFDDAMRLLPDAIEYSRAENIKGNVDLESAITQLGQGFMAILPMLNHGEITMDQAEQFRNKWEELSGYHAIYEQRDGEWIVKFPEIPES